MAWDAIYEHGYYRPIAWIDSETGETRLPSNPPPGGLAPRMCSASRPCQAACLNEMAGYQACPVFDVPGSRDPAAIEEWLAT